MNTPDSTPLAAGGNGCKCGDSGYRTCGRCLAHSFNPRPRALRIKKHNPRVVLRLCVKVLIRALINPPAMNITTVVADAAAPAEWGKRFMAREFEIGLVMVVPAVQISIGIKTVQVEISFP